MPTVDVLIIGAGLSALAAARTLSSTAANVVILEARNRIGGRALTYSRPDGPHIDLGCSMIHGYYEGNPAKRLLEELGMDVHIPMGAKGLVYGDKGPMTEADATSLFASSTQMAYSPSPDTPSSASVASLLFPTLSKDERLVAIARTAEIGAGVELERTSAKWTGFERGFKGTDAFPEGGYGREVMSNLVADFKSVGGEVKLEEEVVSLEEVNDAEGGAVQVKVTTRSGSVYLAKFVISTIPLSVLQKRPPTFSPPLSPMFRSAVNRTTVGVLEKVVLGYPSPWWPSPQETGSYLLLPLSTASVSPSESGSPDAPQPNSLRDLFERTTIPVTSFERIGSTPHATLLAYFGARAGEFISKYDKDEVASELHAYLVERLASDSTRSPPPRPSFSVVSDWLNDPFSLGATSTPITLPRSSTSTSTSSALESTPLDFVILGRPEWDGRLGFAGEHTDLDNHGSVAGALVSGKREGERVKVELERLERQRNEKEQ
ncbi:hypothetical protein JCM10212_002011 [Sporobolomyces blumeae]